MADAEMTPIEMLSRHFSDANLPAPRQPVCEEISVVEAEIDRASKKSGASGLFKMLYDLLF